LSELGVFVREAIKESDADFKSNIFSAWFGFNADSDTVQSLLDGKSLSDVSAKVSGSDSKQDSAATKKEWMRLAGALGKLG